MWNLGGEIPGLPKLPDVLLCDGGGHPPALIGPDMVEGPNLWLEPWVLKLEVREGKG